MASARFLGNSHDQQHRVLLSEFIGSKLSRVYPILCAGIMLWHLLHLLIISHYPETGNMSSSFSLVLFSGVSDHFRTPRRIFIAFKNHLVETADRLENCGSIARMSHKCGLHLDFWVALEALAKTKKSGYAGNVIVIVQLFGSSVLPEYQTEAEFIARAPKQWSNSHNLKYMPRIVQLEGLLKRGFSVPLCISGEMMLMKRCSGSYGVLF